MNENNMTPAVMGNDSVISVDGVDYIGGLTKGTQAFCSMNASTQQEKARLYRGMNNPDERIGDHINEVIHVKDVYCEIVTLTNRDTGLVESVPRIVLFDAEGKSYQAVSKGVYSAVCKLFQIFGVPTWDEPLPIKIRQIGKNDRKMLTFDVVE